MKKTRHTFSLQAGEIALWRLPRGSQLYLLQGQAYLHLPVQWQAETVLFPSLAVPGETLLPVEGMVQLQATDAVRVVLLMPDRDSVLNRLLKGIRCLGRLTAA
ncbi:hypothetical protein [Leeia aquatica]|uniref:Uncharacterized protein n=1 Tax=Leeia aquatica TaxID=2725557 RepID=A0A847S215_9NEIS|nr:hypothetical protein [Leeia aquatica]NLR75871.1 hypothetical protein [Leeia aquatica]